MFKNYVFNKTFYIIFYGLMNRSGQASGAKSEGGGEEQRSAVGKVGEGGGVTSRCRHARCSPALTPSPHTSDLSRDMSPFLSFYIFPHPPFPFPISAVFFFFILCGLIKCKKKRAFFFGVKEKRKNLSVLYHQKVNRPCPVCF